MVFIIIVNKIKQIGYYLMDIDLTGLSPVPLTLASTMQILPVIVAESVPPLSVYMLPIPNSQLSLTATTPFSAPSGLTIM